MKFNVLVFLAFATLAWSRNLAPFLVKESVNVPSDWIKYDVAPDSHMINMQIGLRQRGVDELEARLMDVSNPSSANYGRHLTKSEVEEMLKPSEESFNSVKRWLSENGIEENIQKRSSSGDWIHASMTVGQAKRMLGGEDKTQFHIYQHRSTGEKIVRTTEYSVPRDLFDHVDLISPTTFFEQPKGSKSSLDGTPFKRELTSLAARDGDVPQSCNTSLVTLQCLRDFYGTSDYVVQNPKSQLVSTAGFLDQYANHSDLTAYLEEERPEAAKANYQFNLVKIDDDGNAYNASQPQFEGALDTQVMAGMAYPIPSTYYFAGGKAPLIRQPSSPPNATNPPFATFFDYLIGLSDKELPSIVSVSYDDAEQTVPLAYQKRVCNAAATLGLRGVSIFVASGDSGVGPAPCLTNDGKKQTKFQPLFPASCPYVTTVGATEDFSPERATYSPQFHTGGGFSNSWPMPDYQKDVVTAYVDSLNGTYKGLYNPNGRAYPDIAAQGVNYHISVGGHFKLQSGTSASSPLAAGIFALLNDKRISEGKSKLGFLNPLLYSGLGEKALNDITIGSNNGCGTDGFPAKKGWDAVAGWGTPNFKKLIEFAA